LPVHNAQSTIADRVRDLLEVLPELTDCFELVVIDDGSTDATIEVADELAQQYPQLGVVRHGRWLGRVAAIRTGLKRIRGEIILIVEDDCCLAIDELHRLWSAMEEHEVVVGRARRGAIAAWNRWLPHVRRPQGGYQMVTRTAIGPLLRSMEDQGTLWADLSTLDLRWHAVEVGVRAPRSLGKRRDAAPRSQQPRAQSVEPRYTPHAGRQAAKPRRPNFLTRARKFLREE